MGADVSKPRELVEMIESRLGPRFGRPLAKLIVALAALAFIAVCIDGIVGVGLGGWRIFHSERAVSPPPVSGQRASEEAKPSGEVRSEGAAAVSTPKPKPARPPSASTEKPKESPQLTSAPTVSVDNSPGSIIAPSGGSNTIINNGSPRRMLDGDGRSYMTSHIPAGRKVIVTILNPQDADSQQFADQIAQFLNNSGYSATVDHSIMFSAGPDGPERGVRVNVPIDPQKPATISVGLGQ